MILLKKFNGAFKIFHSFANQEERQNFGGTAFMELQYCTLRPETEIKKIVGVGAHGNWMDSSLYIYLDDIESFCLNYGDIFYGGTYNNLHKGRLDINGINYYTPAQAKEILLKIEGKKPLDYEVISEWLKNGKQYNGFYVLGV